MKPAYLALVFSDVDSTPLNGGTFPPDGSQPHAGHRQQRVRIRRSINDSEDDRKPGCRPAISFGLVEEG